MEDIRPPPTVVGIPPPVAQPSKTVPATPHSYFRDVGLLALYVLVTVGFLFGVFQSVISLSRTEARITAAERRMGLLYMEIKTRKRTAMTESEHVAFLAELQRLNPTLIVPIPKKPKTP